MQDIFINSNQIIKNIRSIYIRSLHTECYFNWNSSVIGFDEWKFSIAITLECVDEIWWKSDVVPKFIDAVRELILQDRHETYS